MGYLYLRLPQGFLASNDTYTSCYDNVTKDVLCKVKMVDDTCLYDYNIEKAFFSTWNYLGLCAKSGIVINETKFKFCQDIVEFAGLQITPSGITPSDKLLSAIKNFPIPTYITDACSWFGLVNHIAWAYAINPIMQPFQELVKHNSSFTWDSTLNQLFINSRYIIVSKIQEGIHMFDPQQHTCLQTDWSKEGIGYFYKNIVTVH